MVEGEMHYIAFDPTSGALLAWGKSAFHAVLAADQYAPSAPIRVFRAGDVAGLAGYGPSARCLDDRVMIALQAIVAI